VIRRRLTEIPLRLIISRNGDNVTLVDEIGRSQTLKADGKKQDRVTGDGEFTSKTRFEGTRLVVGRLRRAKADHDDHATARRRQMLRLEVTMKARACPAPAGTSGSAGSLSPDPRGSGASTTPKRDSLSISVCRSSTARRSLPRRRSGLTSACCGSGLVGLEPHALPASSL
jgi:hypothetical protein